MAKAWQVNRWGVICAVFVVFSIILLGFDDSVVHQALYQVNPYTANLQVGLDTLEHDSRISFTQNGFVEIRGLIINKIAEKLTVNQPERITGITITNAPVNVVPCTDGSIATSVTQLHVQDSLIRDTPVEICALQPDKLPEYVQQAKRAFTQGFGNLLILPTSLTGILTYKTITKRRSEKIKKLGLDTL